MSDIKKELADEWYRALEINPMLLKPRHTLFWWLSKLAAVDKAARAEMLQKVYDALPKEQKVTDPQINLFNAGYNQGLQAAKTTIEAKMADLSKGR
jgi:uncharacterized protein (DUF2164 family)